MQPLPVVEPSPRPHGFTRTPNLKDMAPGTVSGRTFGASPGYTVASPSLAPSPLPAALPPAAAAPQLPTPPPAAGAEQKPALVLRVACDVHDRKVNVEVGFRDIPRTFPALLSALERTLVWDWVGDGEFIPIDISHILRWNEHKGEWGYLCDARDLEDGDQIYVFQKYQRQYAQGPLPPPRMQVKEGDRVNFRDPGRLRVAGDLFGVKCNYEMAYTQLPYTLEDLRLDVERLLTAEAMSLRPQGAAAVDAVVARFVVWDEGLDAWVALQSAQILCDGLQLYCHQAGMVEEEGDLPSPQLVVPGGVMLEKLWMLYRRIDVNSTGKVPQHDMVTAFQSFGLQFPKKSYDELFDALDVNQDGVLHFAEFCQLGLLYPSIVNYLHFMATEYQKFWKHRASFLQRERVNKERLLEAKRQETLLRLEESRLHQERKKYDAQQRSILASAGVSNSYLEQQQ